MRYSNTGEILLMTVAWAALLLVVKNAFDKPVAERVQALFATPQIRITLRHVGCSEQYKEVIRVLSLLPWLGTPLDERNAQAAQATGTPSDAASQPRRATMVPAEQLEERCTVRILATVHRVEQADLMELTRSLRDLGLVPASLEVGGLPHLALKAQMFDMNCTSCVQMALDALMPLPVSTTYYYTTTEKPKEVPKQQAFEWLDSKSVNRAENTITVSVRQNDTAHVEEMLRALETAGLLPISIRIVVKTA